MVLEMEIFLKSNKYMHYKTIPTFVLLRSMGMWRNVPEMEYGEYFILSGD